MKPDFKTIIRLLAVMAMLVSFVTGVARDDIATTQENGTSFKATQKMIEVADDILSDYDKNKYDLVISCLGDSITAGFGAYDSYPGYMGKILGAYVVNLGIKGSTLAWDGLEPMVGRYYDIPYDSDVIFLYGGVNDSVGLTDQNFGDEDKPYTFCGSLHTLLTGIKETYPDAWFVVVIPPPIAGFEWYLSQNDDLYDQNVIREELIRQCKEQEIDMLDLYDMNVMNPLDDKVRREYFGDDIHPNEEGFKVLGMLMAAKVAKYAEEGGFRR